MPIQPIQLDDRTFEQLFAEARSRIPVHTPLWTNFNDSDPGITIVQLFAFMTENLLYRSNRIPEANRRKFLSLLNIGLQPATPARGLVDFRNDRGPIQAFPFPTGQEVRAGKVPFSTRTDVCILPVTAVPYYKLPQPNLDSATKDQFQMLFQTFLSGSTDQLQFYKSKQLPAPEIGKPLPMVDLADHNNGTVDHSLWVALVGPPKVAVQTVRAAIAGQTLSLGIYPSIQGNGSLLPPATSQDNKPVSDPGLVFEIAAPNPDSAIQDTGFATGPAHYTRLTVDYAENVLEVPGIVQVRLPAYSDLLLWDFDPEEEGTGEFPPLVEDKDLAKRLVTWIRIRLPKAQDAGGNGIGNTPGHRGQLAWVGANAARVVQASSVDKEPLGVGTGAPDQTYKVANTPVIVEDTTQIDQSPVSTFLVEVQDANGFWVPWQATDDLFAAKPTDTVYTLDPESGQVTFGSGLHGMRPPVGKNIRVSYEYGGGLDGMVQIGAINKSPQLPGGFKVENPLLTWGASAAETATDGERRISRYLRNRDRLVTSNDFRDITLHTPGVNIGRAEVLPLFNPDLFDPKNITQTWPGTITVMAVPQFNQDSPEPPATDNQFLSAIAGWLDPHRLVTTEVYVREPEYVKVWVSVGITTMAGQMREAVARDVQAAIREYLSPLTGGPPVVSAVTLETDCLSSSTPTDPCARPLGTGWPLSTGVRARDLEAVASRVNGVRYINEIQLGKLSDDGTALLNVPCIDMVGLELPWLSGLSAREGSPEDVQNLLGQPQPAGGGGGAPPKVIPVPVLPAKC